MKIEYSVYRAILQLPTYAANSAIRRETKASFCYARDMKIKLLFAKHLLKENRNDLTEIYSSKNLKHVSFRGKVVSMLW